MTAAVILRQPGAADLLKLEDVPDPVPAAGEAVVRHEAIGVNFLDILQRRGSSPLPHWPAVLGGEAAGIVEAVGPGVTGVAPGDRVAYIGGIGAYATRRSFPADRLVRLPADIDPALAAAALLKGLTAHYLLHRLRPLEAGDTVLFHAAAGGVGLLFCQWAKVLGLRVIGTVSTEEKAELARRHGCQHVVVGYDHDLVLNTVRDVSGGKGVALACDSVGKETFATSVAATAKRGTIAVFGSASGAAPPILLHEYFGRALNFTMPNVAAFNEGGDLQRNATELFDLIRRGALRPQIGGQYPLAETAQAHAAVENRLTAGSILLIP